MGMPEQAQLSLCNATVQRHQEEQMQYLHKF